jgi:hypothetical protein
MQPTTPFRLLAALLLSLLAAPDAARAVPADVCEQQRALYPKEWNDVLAAKALYRCQSKYEGTMLVSVGTPDESGRVIMNLVPIESQGKPKVRLDEEHAVYRIWLDAAQMRRLREGVYFATVVRKEDSCWIRGDLSGDPVFFMDNAYVESDEPNNSPFYNKAPRVSAFKGASYTCEPAE